MVEIVSDTFGTLHRLGKAEVKQFRAVVELLATADKSMFWDASLISNSSAGGEALDALLKPLSGDTRLLAKKVLVAFSALKKGCISTTGIWNPSGELSNN